MNQSETRLIQVSKLSRSRFQSGLLAHLVAHEATVFSFRFNRLRRLSRDRRTHLDNAEGQAQAHFRETGHEITLVLLRWLLDSEMTNAQPSPIEKTVAPYGFDHQSIRTRRKYVAQASQ